MRKHLLTAFTLLMMVNVFSQNVGVGTTTPTEKLDVNGNINVSGTIKANGTDGQPNQILMKNNSGALTWGSLGDYKDFATFLASGSWIVPASVTKISVELWGGGGGGASIGGGGGGGFVLGVFTVSPGTVINFTVGSGGTGAANASASGSDGTVSKVVIGGVEIDALGGSGAYNNSGGNFFSSGDGGSYYADAGFTAFTGIPGQKGTASRKTYSQGGTNIFYETDEMGSGGDGANSQNTGAKGTYYIATPGSLPAPGDVRFTGFNNSKVPGGGGSSYFVNSSAGANGMVVFHY